MVSALNEKELKMEILPPEKRDEQIRSELLETKSRENYLLAVAAGLGSSILGAGLWAALTVITEYQVGWMAIGVGALVGTSVRASGKGTNFSFGIVGALFSLWGCLLGNFLSAAGFIAADEGIRIIEALRIIDYAMVPELMKLTFSPIDVLFYTFAVFEGYKFSFTQLSLYEQSVLNER